MCVMLCASMKVHDWLDLTLAKSYRETLQACAICPSINDSYEPLVAVGGASKPQAAVAQLEKAAAVKVMKRSAWVQAYCRHLAHTSQGNASAQDWHKTLELIANAWGRLLSLVGLRW